LAPELVQPWHPEGEFPGGQWPIADEPPGGQVGVAGQARPPPLHRPEERPCQSVASLQELIGARFGDEGVVRGADWQKVCCAQPLRLDLGCPSEDLPEPVAEGLARIPLKTSA